MFIETYRYLKPVCFQGKARAKIISIELGPRIANSCAGDILLDSRHAIQDFTYSANYLENYVLRSREGGGNGGSGLERHDFHHFDCPLNAESGAFILAKFADGDEEETVLHISAFRIPLRDHT